MSKNQKPSPPIPGASFDMKKYEAFDAHWREIGLAAPARRALVDAKLYRVSDLRKITEEELTDLHGMGKSAVARIKQIMTAKKIRFLL